MSPAPTDGRSQCAVTIASLGELGRVRASVGQASASVGKLVARHDSTADIVLHCIPARATHPLRRLVLRPDSPETALAFPGDDDTRTFHLGAYRRGPEAYRATVGIASIYAEGHPELGRGFRLRGMAVAPAEQRRGIGARLVSECLQRLRDVPRDPAERILWCNARTIAEPFYLSMRFDATGDVFEIAGVGPHRLMWRSI